MLIIGEKINSSIKSVAEAIARRDEGFLRKLAGDQAAAGAHFIDVNAGVFLQEEVALLPWLVELVQSAVDVPLCIDSPNAEAIESALAVVQKKPIVNSLSLEKPRYDSAIKLVKQYHTGIIALCMDERGIPKTAERRVEIAHCLVQQLTRDGVALDDIYLDVMLQPIATDGESGQVSLKTVADIRKAYPEVHITSGLGNISFGLPGRKLLNQAMCLALMVQGMDAFIIDPLDGKIMSLMRAMNALLGHDDFCEDYLAAHRGGLLVV